MIPITLCSPMLHLEGVLFLGLLTILLSWRTLMEVQWRRGALALMSVLMGSVPLASLAQVYIVLLMSWLLMNLDHQIMLLLESVSSVRGVFTTTYTTRVTRYIVISVIAMNCMADNYN